MVRLIWAAVCVAALFVAFYMGAVPRHRTVYWTDPTVQVRP